MSRKKKNHLVRGKLYLKTIARQEKSERLVLEYIGPDDRKPCGVRFHLVAALQEEDWSKTHVWHEYDRFVPLRKEDLLLYLDAVDKTPRFYELLKEAGLEINNHKET